MLNGETNRLLEEEGEEKLPDEEGKEVLPHIESRSRKGKREGDDEQVEINVAVEGTAKNFVATDKGVMQTTAGLHAADKITDREDERKFSVGIDILRHLFKKEGTHGQEDKVESGYLAQNNEKAVDKWLLVSDHRSGMQNYAENHL